MPSILDWFSSQKNEDCKPIVIIENSFLIPLLIVVGILIILVLFIVLSILKSKQFEAIAAYLTLFIVDSINRYGRRR